MSQVKGQGKTLWIAIAIAAALVAVVVLAALKVRLPKPVTNDSPETTPSSVGIVRLSGDTALLQQVELYDPRPLFLPTLINNSAPNLPMRLCREPGNDFKVVPPNFIFAEYEMKIALPEPIAVPGDPVQALHTGEASNPFFAFGRLNFAYTALSPRLAYLEVVLAKSGRVVLATALKLGPDGAIPAGDWQPLEMLLAVEVAGVIGAPVVTKGSGLEEVDDFFRAFLQKQFRMGPRLPPGIYVLRIGQ